MKLVELAEVVWEHLKSHGVPHLFGAEVVIQGER